MYVTRNLNFPPEFREYPHIVPSFIRSGIPNSLISSFVNMATLTHPSRIQNDNYQVIILYLYIFG